MRQVIAPQFGGPKCTTLALVALTLALSCVGAATATTTAIQLTPEDPALGPDQAKRAEFAASGVLLINYPKYNQPSKDDENPHWRLSCSGTLIAPDLFLTAAHCVWKASSAQAASADEATFLGDRLDIFRVFFANADQVYDVAQISLLRGEDGGLKFDWKNQKAYEATKNVDLAIVRLRNPVVGIRPIDLTSGSTDNLGKTYVTIGSGKTSKLANDVGVKRFIGVEMQETCGSVENRNPNFCLNEVTCFIPSKKSDGIVPIWNGDSGGGTFAVAPNSRKVKLVGVTTSSDGLNDIGLATVNVGKKRDWIDPFVEESRRRHAPWTTSVAKAVGYVGDSNVTVDVANYYYTERVPECSGKQIKRPTFITRDQDIRLPIKKGAKALNVSINAAARGLKNPCDVIGPAGIATNLTSGSEYTERSEFVLQLKGPRGEKSATVACAGGDIKAFKTCSVKMPDAGDWRVSIVRKGGGFGMFQLTSTIFH